ncbi:dTDP-4-dehydrorhamnose reductase [Maribacter litoralis]|uniref:dTDP-4-dehydrorhamnose reductase n=1 Tax=Maribacter litoralis TaxID=2059726 RepID=UPI003D272685
MKKVLVTGANGQLGHCLQKIAPDYKDLAFVFKNSKDFDITNKEQMNSLFAVDNFDYCINCAAFTNVEQAEKTPEIAFKVNAEGVKNLALICREYDTSLIHISTDYVFDGEKKEPYSIDDIPNPINEYGKSKLLGEKYIQEMTDDYCIIRTSWLYSEFGKNFYTSILKKAKAGDNLSVTDSQTGCPTNANNLANYILTVLSSNDKSLGIYHFTDGEILNWFEFAEKILANNNLTKNVKLEKVKNYRTFARRPKYSVLHIL